jgi:hypothetical protein
MGRGLAAARRRVPLPVFRGSPWWRAKREGVDGKEGRKELIHGDCWCVIYAHRLLIKP